MKQNVRRIDPDRINLDRCYVESDRQIEVSRRQQALLAAAGESEPHRRWYVLTVLPRAEREVAGALHLANVEAWLPLSDVVPQRRSGRRRQPRSAVQLLAWPGYVFVKVASTPRAWAGLAGIKGVRSVLGTAERPAPVVDEDVLRLKLYLEQDEEARLTLTNGLREGDRVEVSDGPFSTFVGNVLFVDEHGRLRIDVDMLGRAVPVDLQLAQVRKVG